MPALDTQSVTPQGSLPSSQAGLAHRQWIMVLACIGLLALSLRIYFISQAVVDHPIRGDAVQYFTAAWNLIHRHVFSITPPSVPVIHGDSYRDPGFPVFLAIWLKWFGDSGTWYMVTLSAQALLGAATVVLLTAAARSWLTDRWLIGAGFLMAIWPHSVTVSSYLLSETLFGFLCSLSLFLLSVAVRKPAYRWFVASGLCFGAAGLTNAVLMPFAPVLAVALLWWRRLDRKQALVLGLSGLLLPLAWQVRNVQLPPSEHDSGGRALINFVQGSWPEYHASWRASVGLGDPMARLAQTAIMQEYGTLRAHPAQGVAMIYQRMAQDPWHYLGWYLSKPMYLWGWDIQIGAGDIYIYPTLHSPFGYNPALRLLVALCEAINPLLALLAAWGCVSLLLKRHGRPPVAVAMALLVLYVTAIYSLLQAEPRYAIPFRGAEVLLATWGLAQICQWVDRVRRKPRT
jgi:4-amino-4-deoxy-L-arabinose transferase-like glycosyltransferase